MLLVCACHVGHARLASAGVDGHVRRTPRSAARLHSNRGSSAASCCSTVARPLPKPLQDERPLMAVGTTPSRRRSRALRAWTVSRAPGVCGPGPDHRRRTARPEARVSTRPRMRGIAQPRRSKAHSGCVAITAAVEAPRSPPTTTRARRIILLWLAMRSILGHSDDLYRLTFRPRRD